MTKFRKITDNGKPSTPKPKSDEPKYVRTSGQVIGEAEVPDDLGELPTGQRVSVHIFLKTADGMLASYNLGYIPGTMTLPTDVKGAMEVYMKITGDPCPEYTERDDWEWCTEAEAQEIIAQQMLVDSVMAVPKVDLNLPSGIEAIMILRAGFEGAPDMEKKRAFASDVMSFITGGMGRAVDPSDPDFERIVEAVRRKAQRGDGETRH